MFTALLALLLGAGWGVPQRQLVGSDSTYQSQPGDTLLSLARRHGLGLEHIAWANGRAVDLRPLPLKVYRIPGRRIAPRPLKDGLVLNLPERGIHFFRDGQWQGFYPVAIGMPGWCSPVGQFSVAQKTVDPTWMPPAWAGVAGPVGPGPANPLGDRWMGLGYGGYGIHGTNRPDSIGGALSHGCIRMYPEMVRQLFDQVKTGWPVRIEYEPCKAAFDPQGFAGYLCVYPDVYGRCDLATEVRRALLRADLLEWAEPAQIRAWANRPSGRAEHVAGEVIQIQTSDGQVHRLGAARRQGRLYVRVDDLAVVGLNWSANGPRLQITRENHPELWLTPVTLAGQPMVGWLEVVEHFQLDCRVR